MDKNTPIVTLTVQQLLDLFPQREQRDKKYVYGLNGICELFKCSMSRAQVLKRTVIADAVSQDGRTIIVDADRALELFATSSSTKKKKQG